MADIVVGFGGNRQRKKLPWRFAALVLLVLIVATGVGIGVRWWQQQRDHNAARLDTANKAASVAQQQILAGDYDKVHETVDEALDSPGLSQDAKYQLFMQQGVAYSNQKKYDKALESYRQAEAIKQTYDLANAIASVAEEKGDKQLAISYYKKGITLVPDTDPMKASIKKYYQDRIDALEGGEPGA